MTGSSRGIKNNMKSMLGLWYDLEQFLSYNYRTNHIKVHLDCIAYCCCYALNPITNPCIDENTKNNCNAYHQGELLIEALNELIYHVSEKNLPEDNDKRN